MVEVEVLTIYTLGSVASGKHLFYDTLNIKFRDQEGMYKIYTNDYSYKGKDYRYILYFVSGHFKDPSLLASQQRTNCDAVIFLVNPLIERVFENIQILIENIIQAHPNTLITLIMQNVFGNLDSLPLEVQQIAIINGESFFDLETSYNLRLYSLNYDLEEITSLEAGDPMAQFKFFKLFNDTFYNILHECIERSEDPEKKMDVKLEDF